MGLELDRDRYDEDDHRRVAERLQQNLEALAEVMGRPGVGAGEPTIGAELEVCLVDPQGRPVPRNREILAGTTDPRLTLELDRFNLEINTRPSPLAGKPFSFLAGELQSALGRDHPRRAPTARAWPPSASSPPCARRIWDRPRSPTPTATARSPPACAGCATRPSACASRERTRWRSTATMSPWRAPTPRSRCTSAYRRRPSPTPTTPPRSPPRPPWRSPPTRPPCWAGGSGTRRGSLSSARPSTIASRPPPRTGARRASPSATGGPAPGAFELFAESVALHEPLLPMCGPEDPLACVRAGGVPSLHEAARPPRDGVAVEPGRLRRIRRGPRPHREARPPGRAHGRRHDGQRRLPPRPHARPRPRGPDAGPPDDVRPGPAQLLHGGAPGDRRRAPLAHRRASLAAPRARRRPGPAPAPRGRARAPRGGASTPARPGGCSTSSRSVPSGA